MDLIDIQPQFNLYNFRWPIRTGATHDPPAKFVFRDEAQARVGHRDRLAGQPRLHHLRRPHPPQRPRRRLPRELVQRGRGERPLRAACASGGTPSIRRAIIDKDVEIPSGTVIGFDREADRQRFFVTGRRDRRHPEAREARIETHWHVTVTAPAPLEHTQTRCGCGGFAPRSCRRRAEEACTCSHRWCDSKAPSRNSTRHRHTEGRWVIPPRRPHRRHARHS